MLREEAFVAERLEAQLEERHERFLSDRSRNRYNAGRAKLEVSKIFDWYGEDFEQGHKGYASVKATSRVRRSLADSPATARRAREAPMSPSSTTTGRSTTRSESRIDRPPCRSTRPAASRPRSSALAPLRARGAEVIVVDGGSRDATRASWRAPLADRVIDAPRGRALQMNAGARAARGDVLLFLHADTRLPADADARSATRVERSAPGAASTSRSRAGTRCSRWSPASMNLRSRLTGIATGDQAIFVRRDAFERRRFPEIAADGGRRAVAAR